MAFLKIHCDSCGQSWEVYERDMNDEHSRECPHCGSEIDSQTWMGQVLPALGQVADANREIFKDHLGYQTPVFSFDVLSGMKYQNKKKQEEQDELRAEISEISVGIEKLTDAVSILYQV